MMKQNQTVTAATQTLRRYALPLVLILSILTLFSSATYAFVVSRTDAIDNKFEVQTIGMDLQEDTEGETDELTLKKNVQIENTEEATLYVRIKLVLQVLDTDGNPIANPVTYDADGNRTNLALTLENFIDITGENFGKSGDKDWVKLNGVFYYKAPLAAGKTTEVLFETAKPNANVYLYDVTDTSFDTANCPQVALTVLAEGIQLNGVTGAAGEAGVWGDVAVAGDGTLYENNKQGGN